MFWLQMPRPQLLHSHHRGMQLGNQVRDLITEALGLWKSPFPGFWWEEMTLKDACLFLPFYKAGFRPERALGQLPAPAEKSPPDSLGSCSVPAPCSRTPPLGPAANRKPVTAWALGPCRCQLRSFKVKREVPGGGQGKAAWGGPRAGPGRKHIWLTERQEHLRSGKLQGFARHVQGERWTSGQQSRLVGTAGDRRRWWCWRGGQLAPGCWKQEIDKGWSCICENESGVCVKKELEQQEQGVRKPVFCKKSRPGVTRPQASRRGGHSPQPRDSNSAEEENQS